MDAAVREYQAVIRHDPNYYEAHLALGEIHVARRQIGAADTYLRKALERPDSEVRQGALALLKK